MVWAVGTWPLKGAFYANLHKLGIAAGKDADPAGYCHFGTWLDEIYFRQITSEYLATEMFRGRQRRVWTVRNGEENHSLDCEIYNDALADYLGQSRMTEEQWKRLAADRGLPADLDLFSPDVLKVQAGMPAPAKPKAGAKKPAPAAATKEIFIDRRPGGWLRG
jgi:phage terminase large subunit GpA-like protein